MKSSLIQWLHVLALSGFWSLRLLGPARTFSRLRFVIALIFSPKAKPQIIAGRKARCLTCEMYHAPLQTCGCPGEMIWDPEERIPEERNQPLGCWCYLPVAVKAAKKDCWARAQDLPFGWPDDLRHLSHLCPTKATDT